MKLLILYYSRTGNNRTLAHYLAEQIGADIEEIRPLRRLKLLGMLLDFFNNRQPKIAPISKNPEDYEHTLFLAPLYDMGIAHPMKTALVTLKHLLGPYSFVTFCGYQRDKQSDHIHQELLDLTAREPVHIQELHVCDLVPEDKRADVMTVSRYRVKPEELSAYGDSIKTILDWFVATNQQPH